MSENNIDLETVIDFGDELNSTTRIAIFASGSGSNFEALAAACADGRVDAEVAVMVCDRPGAKVIERAARLGVEAFVVSPKEFATKAEYEEAILEKLTELRVEVICLAGYMRILTDTLLSVFPDRILNVHPSLLPAFKGAHAIEQALAYGVKWFGVTIHLVSEELDSGAILNQAAFRYDGHKVAELEQMVHETEHPLYVETLQQFLTEINE
ncbi:MAG: phosphoribosylglycinamide formyltransferase [Rikenellaceae bacterium]